MRSLLRTSAFVLLLALLQGCTRHDPTRSFVTRTVAPEGWDAGERLDFPVDTLAEGGLYVLHVGLRTSASDAYPYRNLALRVASRFPGAHRTRLLHFRLTDEHGDVQGAGISRYQYDAPADTLRLAPGTAGTVGISHAMRRRVLPGIVDLSIRLERVGD